MIKFTEGTQKQVLYDYLLLGKAITTKKAMIDLGIADLQSVIRDLKKAGVFIDTRDIKVHTRYTKKDGTPKYAYVREYKLEKIAEANVHTSTYRTAEEQVEKEQWEGENPFTDEMGRDMDKRHQESHSGNCSYLNTNKGMVSTLQERLDRIK